jgi:hypothetical protein
MTLSMVDEARTGRQEEREWWSDEFTSLDTVSGSPIINDGIQAKLDTYLCILGYCHEPINIGIRFRGDVINLDIAKPKFLSV